MRRFALVAVPIAIAILYLWVLSFRADGMSRSMSRSVAQARARDARAEIRQARSTLRFFERHPRILYGGPLRIRRVGWQEVRAANGRLLRGRARLRVALAALPYRAPWPWPCIFRHENAGQGWRAVSPRGTYRGGLQMDREFELTYAPELVRRYGHADRWPPRLQVATAIEARDSGRGYWPWPTSAHQCGLLP